MKRIYLAATVAAAAILTACGGGGGGSTPVAPTTAAPTATPTAAPTASTLGVRITIAGRGQSSTSTSAHARRPLDLTQAEPVEESIAPPCTAGSLGCNSLAANSYFSSATATIEVVNASGSPVPEATPAVTLASPTAAISPDPSSSANPDATLISVTATTTTPASTTLSAQYPSGGPTGTVGVRQFPFAALQYPAATNQDSAVGYSLQGSVLVPQSTTAGADIYIAVDTSGVTNVYAPGGYETLGAGQAIGLLTSALPFTSVGTSFPLSSLAASPVIVVKAAQGYVGLKFGVEDCSYTTVATACDISGDAGAIYVTADTSGTFR